MRRLLETSPLHQLRVLVAIAPIAASSACAAPAEDGLTHPDEVNVAEAAGELTSICDLDTAARIPAWERSQMPEGPGMQCVKGVRNFMKNVFRYSDAYGTMRPVTMADTLSSDQVGGCKATGACTWELVSGGPDGMDLRNCTYFDWSGGCSGTQRENVWAKRLWPHSTFKPRTYDVVVYGPAFGGGYGHTAVVDHPIYVSGVLRALWLLDTNFSGDGRRQLHCIRVSSVADYAPQAFFRPRVSETCRVDASGLCVLPPAPSVLDTSDGGDGSDDEMGL